MLRTNSKKAKENIHNYIVEYFCPENYAPDFDYIEKAEEDNKAGRRNVDIFSLVAHAIDKIFYDEAIRYNNMYKAGRITRQQLFVDWCAGLPSILNTCYYYYTRNAIDDLGDILEETEEERARYTEEQAAEMLSKLIYREIYNVVSKN